MPCLPSSALLASRALALLLFVALARRGKAQQSLPEPPVPQQALAALIGTVTDSDGAAIPGARVTLHLSAPAASVVEALTSRTGIFSFGRVPAQAFDLTVTAPGFSAAQYSGTLHPDDRLQVPDFRMIAAASDSISVSASPRELAAAELRLEEKQKVLGFIPNFYVTYDWHAPPLTSSQKWQLAWADLTDPDNALIGAGIAGVEQAANALPGYGQETGGYFKRFGAAYADLTANTALTGAALPILFHQDPRYFYKGTGSVRSRALYALSTAVIARGDNGRAQPAYASVLGNFSAGAVTNFLYTPGDRTGVGGVFLNGALTTALDGVTNLLQEFFVKRLTPNAPTYAPPNP